MDVTPGTSGPHLMGMADDGLPHSLRLEAWGNNLAELLAIGIAVRHRDGGDWKAVGGRPLHLRPGRGGGVVGGHHAIEFLAIGTAVTRFRERGRSAPPPAWS